MPYDQFDRSRLILRPLEERTHDLDRSCLIYPNGPREPFEASADDPVVVALQSAAERAWGSPTEIIGRAVVGDANLFVNEGGVTTVYYGTARERITAHSDDERVSVEALWRSAQIYALTAMHYCGVVE